MVVHLKVSFQVPYSVYMIVCKRAYAQCIYEFFYISGSVPTTGSGATSYPYGNQAGPMGAALVQQQAFAANLPPAQVTICNVQSCCFSQYSTVGFHFPCVGKSCTHTVKATAYILSLIHI